MLGLMLKDMLNLKKQIKTIGIILVLYAVIFIPQNNAEFISGMMAMISVMMSLSLFSIDEASKWDKYALSMPITFKDVVLSRYLISIFFILVSAILGFLALIISSKLVQNIPLKEIGINIGVVLAVGLIIISIITPLIYKFGAEKGRILVFVVFLVPTVLVLLWGKIADKFNISNPSPEIINEIINILPYIAPLILILVLVSSYFISINIYRKKEF
ncbi:MAG: ABC-2 transporter permease [Clostridiales bacterium]|nr:ABC-2 transporter permease [Clostridiales bacterium]